jgi:photosystem II stability/assembly factor-like uncharacterized protein
MQLHTSTRRWYFACWLCLGAASIQAASAQTGGFEVTGLGGAGGMYTPTISPTDPSLMFLSCDMGGVYRSADSGGTWQLLPYQQIAHALDCRPAFAGDRIYWISGASTLKVSGDRGLTWTAVGPAQHPWKGVITHLAASQTASLLVGTDKGVWLSPDDGQNWKTVGEGKCGGLTLLGAQYFAALDSADGRQFKTLLRSQNAGQTWQELAIPEAQGHAVTALAGAAERTSICLYATVEGVGTLLSGDGETWTVAQPWQRQREVLLPQNQIQVAYTCQSGSGAREIWRTADGGKSWTSIFHLTGAGRNVTPSWVQTYYRWGYSISPLGLGIDPMNPEVALVSTQGDFYRTVDGGRSWQPIMNRPIPTGADAAGWSFQSIGLEVTTCWGYYFDPTDPNRHYIAYTDIGFARSVDRGATWIPAMKGCPWSNTVYESAFDPRVKGRLYAACSNRHDIPHWTHVGPNTASQQGGVCISEDYAATWRVLGQGLPRLPCTSIALDPRSPADRATLYTTLYEGGVYKSTDGGQTWVPKSDGLGNPGNLHALRIRLHPMTGRLFCLITAFRQGADFPVPGGIWKSTDGGETWKDLTAQLHLAWPCDLAVDPKDENVIYLAAGTAPHRPQGGLYKTSDGGQTWKRIVTDAFLGRWTPPEYDNTLTVTLHPDDSKIVYLGSEAHGLWVSRTAGANWEVFKQFPFRGPTRVDFEPSDRQTIRVSTFGAGAWRGHYLPEIK